MSEVGHYGVEEMPGMTSFAQDAARERARNTVWKFVLGGMVACAGLGGLVWMLN